MQGRSSSLDVLALNPAAVAFVVVIVVASSMASSIAKSISPGGEKECFLALREMCANISLSNC